MYQPGDLVLCFSSQLKPGEPIKFRRQWEGPYEIVDHVSEVTYRVQRRGHLSTRSSVIQFNNLRLYKRAADVSRRVFKTTQTPLGVLVAKPQFLTTRRMSSSRNERVILLQRRDLRRQQVSLPCLEIASKREFKVSWTLLTNKSSLISLVIHLIPHLALRILNAPNTSPFMGAKAT